MKPRSHAHTHTRHRCPQLCRSTLAGIRVATHVHSIALELLSPRQQQLLGGHGCVWYVFVQAFPLLGSITVHGKASRLTPTAEGRVSHSTRRDGYFAGARGRPLTDGVNRVWLQAESWHTEQPNASLCLRANQPVSQSCEVSERKAACRMPHWRARAHSPRHKSAHERIVHLFADPPIPPI